MSVQPHCGKAKLLDHLISRPLTGHPYFSLQISYRNTIFLLMTIKCVLTSGETIWLPYYIHVYTYIGSKLLPKSLTLLKRKCLSIFKSNILIKYLCCYYNSDTSTFNQIIKLLKFASPSISYRHAAKTLIKIKKIWLTSPQCRLVVSLARIYQARPYPCSEVRLRWIPNWFLLVCITKKI